MDNPNLPLSDFNENDRKELSQFLEAERHKAKFQENVHALTAMCWTKCITGKISGSAVDKGESLCLENCVNRYIDAQKSVMDQLEHMRNRG